jgi:hypothetical protein
LLLQAVYFAEKVWQRSWSHFQKKNHLPLIQSNWYSWLL